MSALPPKADIRERIEYVCFVPLADVGVVVLRLAPQGTSSISLGRQVLSNHGSNGR
jgi:hypothetical protein